MEDKIRIYALPDGNAAIGDRSNMATDRPAKIFRRIYHYHVLKTAGTSINNAFCELAYTKELGKVDNADPGEVVYKKISKENSVTGNNYTITGWDADLIQKGDYFYAFSHAPMLRQILPMETYTFTCFRDPVKRVVSRYKHLVDIYRKERLDYYRLGYLKPVMEKGFGEFIRKRSIEMLANQLYMFSPLVNVDQALNNVAMCDRIIFVETFESDLRALSHDVGLELNCYHTRKSQIDVQINQDELDCLQEFLQPEYDFLEKVKKYIYKPSPQSVYILKPARAEPSDIYRTV